MTVTFRFYGRIRELLQKENLDVGNDAPLPELLLSIDPRFGSRNGKFFFLNSNEEISIRVAINDRLLGQEPSNSLPSLFNGDKIAIMPPFAGG